MLRVAYSPIYRYPLPKGHRFPMEKYELLPEQLLYEGSLVEWNFFQPYRLSDQQLLSVHTKEYLSKMKNLEFTRKEVKKIGFPMTRELIERGRYIAAGSYQCATFALEHGISLNIAGGTHHAYADHGEGFCIYNDFALAAHLLLNGSKVNRILILDLDVHQGNGTAHIFRDDERVFTFSMHGERNYPLHKEQSDMDIPLMDGTGDDEYLDVLARSLEFLFTNVQFDIVLYLAGVDVLEQDKLGRLSMSMEGCRRRDELVFETCKSAHIPIAVSMGGGYSPNLADVITAHANTFRTAQKIYF